MTHHLPQRRVAPACRTLASTNGRRGGRPPAIATAVAAISVALGAAGCVDSDAGAADRAGETIREGIPTMRNVLDAPETFRFRVIPELHVGAVEGEAAFGRIADVSPRVDGGMWVLDAQSKWVSGFDRAGTLVVRFGGEGSGPGEFRNVSGVFETAAGRLVVGSPFPPALHWFDTTGAYVESRRFTESSDPDGVRMTPGFAAWSVTRSGRPFADLFTVSGAGSDPGSDPVVPHHVVAFDRDAPAGPPRDTIVSWGVPTVPMSPTAPLPIVPATPKWATGPGELVWWTPGTPYEIIGFDSTGTPVRAITLDRPATAVTPEVREAVAAGMRRSAGSAPGGIGLVEHALSRAEWPEALPHLAGIWVAEPDGTVFAAPYSNSSFDPHLGMMLDVFAPDGGFEGTLRLPPRFSPRRFADGRVYGVESDDLDVNYAVQYRIERER